MPDKRQAAAKRAMGVMRDDGIISNNRHASGLGARAYPKQAASDKCDSQGNSPRCPA